MNASTNAVTAALAAAHAASKQCAIAGQPLVPGDLQLLKTGHLHGSLLLDLHGTLDQHGYDVQAVSISGAAAGCQVVDLSELFSRRELADMSAWCDLHLPSAHQLLLVSQQEARAERLKWERMQI